MPEDIKKELEHERTTSDLLAAALIGQYPKEDALKRYNDGLKTPLERFILVRKPTPIPKPKYYA